MPPIHAARTRNTVRTQLLSVGVAIRVRTVKTIVETRNFRAGATRTANEFTSGHAVFLAGGIHGFL